MTMIERSVTHDTFVIERVYDAAPARVFAAWTDSQIKARWFAGPDEWESQDYELDFRVGGRERSRSGPAGGPVYTYEGHYQDIVPEQRIVYTYEMYVDETRISVSLGTVELMAEGQATRLTYTEQGAYLDGQDTPESRKHGSGALLDALGAELRR